MNDTKPPAVEHGHDHAEAFCLMQYKDEVTGEVEIIWNSRDGVTPFAIQSPAGNEARHVNWDADQYAPDHVPRIGERIFMDRTEEDARRLAEKKVEAGWDRAELPLSQNFDSRQEAIEALTKSQGHPHPETGAIDYGPKTVDVTAGVLKELGLWKERQKRDEVFASLFDGLEEEREDRLRSALRELRDAAANLIPPSGFVLRPFRFKQQRLKKAIKKANRALEDDYLLK